MAWHNKRTGGYGRTSTEALDNAKMAYSVLASKGWTLNAFCGMWGNVEAESAYNPWRWESDVVLNTWQTSLIASSTVHGYGLAQFTPSGKYINNAQSYNGYAPNFNDRAGGNNDGSAQLLYINDHADYYSTAGYPLSYSAYKASTETPAYLARAWFYNYERGTWSDNRVYAAEYWYQVLQGYEPEPPEPPKPETKKKDRLPIWLYPSVGRTMGLYNFANVPILSRGDRGSLVRTIQALLWCYGFFGEGLTFSECVDSDYGTMTVDAVIKFQREFDLVVDGIVGKETFKKLGGFF